MRQPPVTMRGLVSGSTQPHAPTKREASAALVRRAAGRDDLPLVALGLLVIGMTLLLGRIADTNHNVFADEAKAIFFGRDIAGDWSLALSGSIGRGTERLTSIVSALIAGTTDSASHEVRLLHWVMALCQGLVAVPAWLAGRQLGLSRWAAVLAAAIAASGSFAVYGIFTLNQSIGLLCATVMLWGMVRALSRPGLTSDLIVLAGLAATALARLGWAPLVLALIPAVLAATWFERPAGEPVGGWLRALPRRLARRHPLLVPLLLVGIAAVLALGPSELLGGEYGGVRLEPDVELGTLWDNARFVFSHLAIGLALVPFILAAPALIRDLGKPADATSGGYAWLVLGLVVILSYAYYSSVNEDRYLAVLVPPFAIAAALAVFRRPPPLWAVLVSGVLVARLVVTSYGWPSQDPFAFFVAPTSLFFERIVVGDLGSRLPFSTTHVPTLALLAAVAGALVIAVVAGNRRARRPLGLAAAATVLAGVLAFQVAAAEYPARKFVEAVGMPHVREQDLSFIDRAANDGHVEPLALDGALDPDVNGLLDLLRVYNGTLGDGVALPVDWRTGSVDDGGADVDMLLEKQGFEAVRFAGMALAPSKLFPVLRLRRLERPFAARWVARGAVGEGFPEGGHPLRLRVFAPAGASACVRGAVAVHALADRASRYRLSGGRRTLSGEAAVGTPAPFVARVAGGRPTTLVLRGSAVGLPDGRRLGPTLANVEVAACD